MENLRAKYSKRLRIKALIGRVFEKSRKPYMGSPGYTGQRQVNRKFQGPSGRWFMVVQRGGRKQVIRTVPDGAQQAQEHGPQVQTSPFKGKQNKAPDPESKRSQRRLAEGRRIRPANLGGPDSGVNTVELGMDTDLGAEVPTLKGTVRTPRDAQSKQSQRRLAKKETTKQVREGVITSDIDQLEVAAADDHEVLPVLADAYEEAGDDKTAGRIRDWYTGKEQRQALDGAWSEFITEAFYDMVNEPASEAEDMAQLVQLVDFGMTQDKNYKPYSKPVWNEENQYWTWADGDDTVDIPGYQQRVAKWVYDNFKLGDQINEKPNDNKVRVAKIIQDSSGLLDANRGFDEIGDINAHDAVRLLGTDDLVDAVVFGNQLLEEMDVAKERGDEGFYDYLVPLVANFRQAMEEHRKHV